LDYRVKGQYAYVMENLYLWNTDRWLIPSDINMTKDLFEHLYFLEHNLDIVKPQKPLPLKSISTNGQEYSSYYGIQNLCSGNGTCYCTTAKENVNIVIQIDVNSGVDENIIMFVKEIEIIPPGLGYSAPVETAIVFLSHDKPNESQSDFYNHITEEKYNESLSHIPIRTRQLQGQPITYHYIPKEGSKVVLPTPLPTGRFILLKLLTSGGDKANIDILHFKVYGFLYNLKEKRVMDSNVESKKERNVNILIEM